MRTKSSVADSNKERDLSILIKINTNPVLKQPKSLAATLKQRREMKEKIKMERE